MNVVEIWFSILTKQQVRRGVDHDVPRTDPRDRDVHRRLKGPRQSKWWVSGSSRGCWPPHGSAADIGDTGKGSGGVQRRGSAAKPITCKVVGPNDQRAQPFVWTKTAEDVLAKTTRQRANPGTLH
jgi:hypothetical protein